MKCDRGTKVKTRTISLSLAYLTPSSCVSPFFVVFFLVLVSSFSSFAFVVCCLQSQVSMLMPIPMLNCLPTFFDLFPPHVNALSGITTMQPKKSAQEQ